MVSIPILYRFNWVYIIHNLWLLSLQLVMGRVKEIEHTSTVLEYITMMSFNTLRTRKPSIPAFPAFWRDTRMYVWCRDADMHICNARTLVSQEKCSLLIIHPSAIFASIFHKGLQDPSTTVMLIVHVLFHITPMHQLYNMHNDVNNNSIVC